VLAHADESEDYRWARPSLVTQKCRAMELAAGLPQKKGNRRGPSYAYNVKELRHQEARIAEHAEKSHEQFVAAWRMHPPRKEGGCATASNRQELNGLPGDASSRHATLRHEVDRTMKNSRKRNKGLVDLICGVSNGKKCPCLTTFLDAGGCNVWRISFIQRHSHEESSSIRVIGAQETKIQNCLFKSFEP
jgi:hypothetical protein